MKDRQSSSSSSTASNKTHSYINNINNKNNNKLASKERSSINNKNNNNYYSQRQKPDTSQHYQSPISSIQDISRSIWPVSSSANNNNNNNNNNSLFQPKLKISQPGDVYEREADRIAEKVMSMASIPLSYSAVPPIGGGRSKAQGNEIDKKCSACEMKEKEKKGEEKEQQVLNIGRKSSAAQSSPSSEASDQVTNDINNILSSSSGSPLDANTKEFMQSRFGSSYDFSNVRIHTNEAAAKSSNSVNALAYTVGSDIVFGEGQYQPNTTQGRKLIAHELTHVIQQTGRDEKRLEFRPLEYSMTKQKTAHTIAPHALSPHLQENSIAVEKVSIPHIQRQPATKQAGDRVATVVVRWSSSADELFEAIHKALMRDRAFRGIHPTEFTKSDHREPGLRAKVRQFFSDYVASPPLPREGERIRIQVSAYYSADPEYQARQLFNIRVTRYEPTVPKPSKEPGYGEEEIARGTVTINGSGETHVEWHFGFFHGAVDYPKNSTVYSVINKDVMENYSPAVVLPEYGTTNWLAFHRIKGKSEWELDRASKGIWPAQKAVLVPNPVVPHVEPSGAPAAPRVNLGPTSDYEEIMADDPRHINRRLQKIAAQSVVNVLNPIPFTEYDEHGNLSMSGNPLDFLPKMPKGHKTNATSAGSKTKVRWWKGSDTGRTITFEKLMNWEKGDNSGPHTLAKHGSFHTKETLRQRIVGETEITPPGGDIIIKGKKEKVVEDWRIWEGKKQGAASKWISDDVMVKSINSIVEDNISAIEEFARSAKPGSVEPFVGHFGKTKVGEGWAKIKKGGIFWNEELNGAMVKIIADGKGGWSVLTAYPTR